MTEHAGNMTDDAPPAATSTTDLSRKQFLTAASLGLGGLMGALIVVPVAGMALTPAIKSKDFEPVFIGNVDEFPAGKFVKVVLRPGRQDPDAYVKKLVAFVRMNEDPKSDRFAPPGQGEFSVISNTCMHLGCPVQSSSSGFVCPCHGGSYDADGKRIAGPPVRPLDRYEWERRGDELWAIDRYSLTQDGKQVKHRDAGQFTNGPESLFYPLQP